MQVQLQQLLHSVATIQAVSYTHLIRPTMKLTYDDLANQISNELSSSDYVVTGYSGNINAGAENGASVTLEGRGLYKGTLTLNFTCLLYTSMQQDRDVPVSSRDLK